MTKSSLALSLVISSSFLNAGCAHRSVRETSEANPIQAETNETTSSRRIAGMEVREMREPAHVIASSPYHFAMAQAYSAEGNPDRAIEEYKLALVYDAKSALIRTRLATEYVKKGMLTAAMEVAKEAVQIDAKNVDARLILGGLYSGIRQNDEALAQYNAILKVDPANEEAVAYKAQIYLDMEKPAQAVQTMAGFVKKNPESALGWYYLGRSQHKAGKYSEAEKGYKKALDLKPSFTQALLSLGFLHEENNRNDRAIAVYRDLYDQHQDVTAAGRLATIFLKTEKYEESIPYLEAVRTNDPDDLNTQVKLALVHMELKHYDRAITLFQELLGKNPDSDRLHYYLGSLYVETEQVDSAVREFSLVPADSKLFGESAMHAAQLLYKKGRVDDARKSLQASIAKSPKSSPLYVFLASLEEDAKNSAGAIAVLEDAYKIFPEDERVLYYLGSLYDRQGQADKGMAKMEQLLFVNPNNVDALNYIGYTWTTQGVRLDDAEEMIKKAMALKPGNPFIMDSWGWHQFVRGKTSAAIATLEKAAQIKGDEATILDHLADAYSRAGLSEKALAMYEKAAKFAEESKLKDEIARKSDQLRTVLARNGRLKGAPQATRRPASVPGVSANE